MACKARGISTIGFDADDTLWQNETFFRSTQDHFARLLEGHADPAHLIERLEAAERRNLGRYGFGVKGFILSMIETALEVTENRLPGHLVREVIEAGHQMLAQPVELLPSARATIEALADSHRLVLVTKGDLLDQERKLAQSGLGDFFHAVEIVSDKTSATYRSVFARHGDGPERALMVGNSLRSDVLPAIEAGAHGVHVPHQLTWSYETAALPEKIDRFHELTELGELPRLITDLG